MYEMITMNAWAKIVHKNEVVAKGRSGKIVVVEQEEYIQVMKKAIKAELNRKENGKCMMWQPPGWAAV